jgi:hypothetical protein
MFSFMADKYRNLWETPTPKLDGLLVDLLESKCCGACYSAVM